MDQFLLFVLVGRRMYWALWNATIWSVSHKKHFWKLHFFKIGQFLSNKLYKFLISDLNFKIDVYDLQLVSFDTSLGCWIQPTLINCQHIIKPLALGTSLMFYLLLLLTTIVSRWSIRIKHCIKLHPHEYWWLVYSSSLQSRVCQDLENSSTVAANSPPNENRPGRTFLVIHQEN